MSTETLTKPTAGRGGNDDPLIHSLPPGTPIEPGRKAYCGTRIKGIPAPRMGRLCVVCESMRKDGGRLPGLNV